ncbi:hypothetical protein ONZ45_g2799 [Pleurotus djamor]|nr:hypothetical protein ONZ45_g2799 [Pleurotus djamor]
MPSILFTLVSTTFVLSLFPVFSIAQPFNVTVDDTNGPFPKIGGNITYSRGWMKSRIESTANESTDGFPQAMNDTWSLSVYARDDPMGPPPNATFRFNGTAVYVWCILTDVTADGVRANSEMLFFLDGGESANFTRGKVGDGTYQVASVYHKDGLSDQEHELVIQNGRQTNGTYMHVVALLDAIIYTTGNGTVLPASPTENEPTLNGDGVLAGPMHHETQAVDIGVDILIQINIHADATDPAAYALFGVQQPYERPDDGNNGDGGRVRRRAAFMARWHV